MSLAAQRIFALLVVLAISLGSTGLVYAGGFGPAQGAGGEGSSLSGLGSTDNAIVRTDGTGGDRVQGSSVTIDDTGMLAPRSVLFSSTGMVTDSGSAVALQGSAAGTGLALGSGATLRWSSSASYSGTKDTGLKRAAAGVLQVTDGSSGGGALKVGTYTVATLPSASTVGAGTIVYVSDGAAGSPVLAFSDGTNWLRCDTLAAVSDS